MLSYDEHSKIHFKNELKKKKSKIKKFRENWANIFKI